MQNTKTFILKAAISSLLVLSTMSFGGYAESWEHTFCFGTIPEKGFFWYNDKEPVKDEEEQPQQPLTGSPSQDKKKSLSSIHAG